MSQSGSQTETQSETPTTSPRLWIGYVVPMVAYLMLTTLEGWDGSGIPYVWLYLFKAILVTATLIMTRKVWKDIRFDAKVILPSVLIGIVAFVMWVVVDRYTYHFAFLGTRKAFNPRAAISDPTIRTLFLIVRFYGLAVMVPVMEELFWRSFLLRWFTDPDFARLPIGTYSWSAFWIVAGAFGLAHPEWLAAILFAALTALLLKQTRSLFACVLVHSVTNLLLGLYVMRTGNWSLW